MPASFSVARATATLPRHWSKSHSSSQSFQIEPRISKRQESANKTRLILQNYLKRGVEPSPEVLDNLDPTNVSYDGTLSSKGSSDSLRLSAASNERRKLVKKQRRRQSILPSFFEPVTPKSKSPTVNGEQTPVALTAAALTAHDHPAIAFLAEQSRVIRRATSFAGPLPTPPTILIIKPEPECLDDHSNPSSRDPFYYDKVLNDINLHIPLTPPRPPRKTLSKSHCKIHPRPSRSEPESVTSWFADQYLQST